MEHATKLILVPPELYTRLKKDNLSELDKQMHEILFDSKVSDFEKWQLYSQCLQRYLHFVNENEKNVEVEIIEKEGSKDDSQMYKSFHKELKKKIVNKLPQNLKSKGVELYDILAGTNTVHWGSDGQVFLNTGKLQGSSIVDLICKCVGSGPTADPVCLPEFRAALQNSNIPNKFFTAQNQHQILVPQGNQQGLVAAEAPGIAQAVAEARALNLNIRPELASKQKRNRRKFEPYQAGDWRKYKL
jgi:hypothetical protein